ncbi:MAG TPA: VOC family protein [Aquihabitans sp.]|nr:VOC family protein [Aquihabitans sp.]
MEVLSSRYIVRCADLERSAAFWTERVGLRLQREYGAGGRRTGVVLFCGGGSLELTGGGAPVADGSAPEGGAVLWLQVPDVDAEAGRLAAGGLEVRGPTTEPWGLREAWFDGPDGVAVVLVEVPEGHPLRSRVDP